MWTTKWRRWNEGDDEERERERERNECAREMMLIFRGQFWTPSVRSKSRLSRHAHRSLSLSLLFERFQSSRERDERERRARVVSERTISSFDCFFERFSSNFFSHQIIVSLERKRTHFSLSREREKMSRVRCKIPDTKSTPKRLHANKKTKRARQFRTVCASENIFIMRMRFSLRALKRVCLWRFFYYTRAESRRRLYFLFPLRREREVVDTLFGDSRSIRV